MPKKPEKLGKGGKPIKRDANGLIVKGSGAPEGAGRPRNHLSHTARQAYWEGRDADEIEKLVTRKNPRKGISSLDFNIIMRIYEASKEGGLPSYKELVDRKEGKSRQKFMIETPLVDETQIDKREVARQVAFLLSLGLPDNGDTGARKQPTIAEPRSPRTGPILLPEDGAVHGRPEAGS